EAGRLSPERRAGDEACQRRPHGGHPLFLLFLLARLQDRRGDLGIDAYCMAAKVERELCRRSVDLDRPRPLVGHVTIDTMRDHSRPDPGGHLVLADLMTPQALPRKPRQLSFRFMDVATRRTGHRRAVAAAPAAP